MLIFEVILDLKSKQGDITAAFLHSEVSEGDNIYVAMTRSFRRKLKLLKSRNTLYVLRQNSRPFWKYLTENLETCKLKQSESDQCLFMGYKVVCIFYFDDLLFWAKDEADITQFALIFRNEGFDIDKEDDDSGFLWVKLECVGIYCKLIPD